MEQFTRECLELDGSSAQSPETSPEQNMKRVYSNAATLVKNTLDLEGAVVLDVSNFEVLHTTGGPAGSSPIKTYHGDLFSSTLASSSPGGKTLNDSSDDAADQTGEKRHEFGRIPALPVLGAAENASSPHTTRNEPLSGEAHAKLASFLANFPDGRIYERVVPSCFRGIVPNNLQYAMGTLNTCLLLCCVLRKRTIWRLISTLWVFVFYSRPDIQRGWPTFHSSLRVHDRSDEALPRRL